LSEFTDHVASLVPRTTSYVTSLVAPKTVADAWRSPGGSSCYTGCYSYYSQCAPLGGGAGRALVTSCLNGFTSFHGCC
jgi:hypothetical protein